MRIPVRQLLVATPVILSAGLLAISTGFSSIAGAAGSNYISDGGTVSVITGTVGQTANYAIQDVVSVTPEKRTIANAAVRGGTVQVKVPPGAIPSGNELVVAKATSTTTVEGLTTTTTAFFVGVYNKTTGVKNNSTFAAPIKVTVKSSSIKIGDVAFALEDGAYSEVGVATHNGVITLTISQDPQIVIGRAKPMTIVQLHSTGLNVKTLQKALNAHKASPKLVVDGIFGKATLAAVKKFQKSHHLVADGVVGKGTWTALGL